MSAGACGTRLNATIVHRPGDDLSQPIDYRVAAKFADVFRRVTLETANAAERAEMVSGEPVRPAFAPSAPKASSSVRTP